MKFVAESEPWNVYRLADGTEVRVRIILVGVHRREGQYAENGAPIYDFNIQQLIHVDPPEELQQLAAGVTRQ